MRKLATVALASTASLALLATPALAAVSFDPATGDGFAGKGDVKDALMLTEKQVQEQGKAGVIDFFTTNTQDFTFTCEDEVEKEIRLGNNGLIPSDGASINGKGKKQKITVTLVDNQQVTDTVTTEVTGGTRKNPQTSVTGFNLTGYGAASSSITPPVEGDVCEGVDETTAEPFTGTVFGVEAGTPTEKVLNVTNGTTTALLPNTPVATV